MYYTKRYGMVTCKEESKLLAKIDRDLKKEKKHNGKSRKIKRAEVINARHKQSNKHSYG